MPFPVQEASEAMGDGMGSSSNAPQPLHQLPRQGRGQQGQKEEQKHEQQHREQDARRAFDLECESYTAQMYIDDLGRFGAAADADVTSLFGRHLLYPLHSAVNSDRADVVRFMLEKGYFKDVLNAKGRTPLQEAARAGSLAVVQALLAADADISLGARQGESALDIAVADGHVGITRAIVDHGADVNVFDAIGRTPAHRAAVLDSADVLSLLMAKGADIDVLDRMGLSPLHYASCGGKASTTRALLAAGADTNNSALGIAAGNGYVDVVLAHVEHGADVNAAGRQGYSALHMAAFQDKAAVIEVLAEAGANVELENDDGITALHIAAAFSRPAAVAALLKHGALVSQSSPLGETSLHCAVCNAGKLGAAEVVDLLLRHGADEKAIVDTNGKSPAFLVGFNVNEQDRLAEDVERVHQLLANAPADRAWRRRGFLVLCRAYYPSGRVQLGYGSSHGHDTGVAKMARCVPQPSRAEAEWAGVASMLMGVGADPIALMGGGADIIFESIVGFL